MFIIASTPLAVIIIIYAICKWLKRQSNREKEFWCDQKNLRGAQGCKLYAFAKAILLLIAMAGALLIVVSLAYGQVPRLHDLTNEKFQLAFLGAAILLFLQLIPFGLIYLIKRASKRNLGKVILFFIVIGGIVAALLTTIFLAAF